MFNVCFNCGEYRVDKIIDPDGPYAICPVCGHKHAFLSLPLLIVSGASGTGKSTVCNYLVGTVKQAVILDNDILWREEFNRRENNYLDFFETWLRVAKNISQSGRPVVLFGAGVGVPENMEPCVERRYFSELHYLALTCEDEVLADRLRRRPQWRDSSSEIYVQEHVRFNRWFKEEGPTTEPGITLLDTTASSVEETAAQVADWIGKKIEVVE
jgi:predicted kinase